MVDIRFSERCKRFWMTKLVVFERRGELPRIRWLLCLANSTGCISIEIIRDFPRFLGMKSRLLRSSEESLRMEKFNLHKISLAVPSSPPGTLSIELFDIETFRKARFKLQSLSVQEPSFSIRMVPVCSFFTFTLKVLPNDNL